MKICGDQRLMEKINNGNNLLNLAQSRLSIYQETKKT